MQIYSDIAAPQIKRGAPGNKYPFAEMAVGQSIYVPLDGDEADKVVERLKSAAARWRKSNGAEAIKFTVAPAHHPEDVTKECVGVWRVA
jgi:hypothetical protein